MKITIAALLPVILSAFAMAQGNTAASAAIAHLDAREILLKCHDADGPGSIAVMREITHPNGKDYDWDVWQAITEQIAQGNARASGCLAHGARYGGCASCANMLDTAWAQALRSNPKAVLALHQWVSIDAACSLPFLEADEAFLQQYSAEALAALNQLAVTAQDDADAVQDARRRCQWSLKAAYLDPHRCKFDGEETLCPQVKQECRFNGETYVCQSQ